MLTKQIRTHILFLRDGRSYDITKKQYEILKITKQDNKRNDFFKLSDCDTGETLYEGELGEIKEFKERRFGNSNYNAICEFGVRHQISNGNFNCICEKTYGIPEIWAFMMFKKEFGVNHKTDITETMRINLKNKFILDPFYLKKFKDEKREI